MNQIKKSDAAGPQAQSQQYKLGGGGRLFCGLVGVLALLMGLSLLRASLSSSSALSILIGVCLLIVGGGGVYYAVARNANPSNP